MSQLQIATFYRFTDLPDYQQLRQPLLERMLELDIKGTILLAAEGVNGTVSGAEHSIAQLFAWLQSRPWCRDSVVRYAWASRHPYHRTKVKIKKEIVTMGVPGLSHCPGTPVPPDKWNRLIQRDDVLLIDTRNDYEHAIGTFQGAVNPGLDCFRNFPRYLHDQLLPAMQSKKIRALAMFCTGGIRCEKASSLAKTSGISEVYQLKGGILAYLQQIPQEQSLWVGECFVFDNRTAVVQGLQQGSYHQCYGCRYPITEQDKRHPHYCEGQHCPRCYRYRSEKQRQRGAERMKQISLARQRGESHLAPKRQTTIHNSQKVARKENPELTGRHLSARPGDVWITDL